MLGRVAYEVSNGLTTGVNVSYDEVFEARVSADLIVRFGSQSATKQRKKVRQLNVFNVLTSALGKRDIRVHNKNLNKVPGCTIFIVVCLMMDKDAQKLQL